MPIDRHPRRGKTPEEIAIEQRRQAEILRDQQRQQQAERSSHQANVSPDVMPPASVPAKATPTVPATNAIDTRTTHQRYLDSVSPTAIVGRLIRFSKDGVFVTSDDEQPVDGDTNFYGLCDEVQIGWIKYAQEEGGETQRVAGLLYDDYELQERSSLGDDDETRWPVGLDGTTPEDPWSTFRTWCSSGLIPEKCLPSRPHRKPAAAVSVICLDITIVCNVRIPAMCQSCGCALAASIIPIHASAGWRRRCFVLSVTHRATPQRRRTLRLVAT